MPPVREIVFKVLKSVLKIEQYLLIAEGYYTLQCFFLLSLLQTENLLTSKLIGTC